MQRGRRDAHVDDLGYGGWSRCACHWITLFDIGAVLSSPPIHIGEFLYSAAAPRLYHGHSTDTENGPVTDYFGAVAKCQIFLEDLVPGRGVRTPDLLITNQPLYLLS